MSSTDTNQASEDELRKKIDDVLSHFEVTVPNLGEVGLYDLVHPRIKDKYGNGVEWGIVINDEIMHLLRTEKLKLLAEVRERVVDKPTGNHNADSLLERDVLVYNQATAYLRTELTKLEAEL